MRSQKGFDFRAQLEAAGAVLRQEGGTLGRPAREGFVKQRLEISPRGRTHGWAS